MATNWFTSQYAPGTEVRYRYRGQEHLLPSVWLQNYGWTPGKRASDLQDGDIEVRNAGAEYRIVEPKRTQSFVVYHLLDAATGRRCMVIGTSTRSGTAATFIDAYAGAIKVAEEAGVPRAAWRKIPWESAYESGRNHWHKSVFSRNSSATIVISASR